MRCCVQIMYMGVAMYAPSVALEACEYTVLHYVSLYNYYLNEYS